jgi:tRNA 2-thiouridine synthesizing protein A
MTRATGTRDDGGGEGAPHEAWDAGDMGCGELLVRLRGLMASLGPGEVLRLVARDPGAREDLPAWCRLTGHALREAAHPVYLIERRKE